MDSETIVEATLTTKDYKTFIFRHANGFVETSDIQNVSPAFPDDTVLYDITNLRVVKILHRNEHYIKGIVGVLDTSSKIKYGIDKKGHYIYLFHPIYKNLPSFLVSSKINSPIYNHWVVIDYLDWTKNRPRGCMVQDLGVVNNQLVERQALIKHYRPIALSKKDSQMEICQIVDTYHSMDWKNGLNIVEGPVVSIDPPGCNDIDDAFSIKDTSSHYILSIHIAHVANWVKEGSYLDNHAKRIGSTLYLSDSNIPMYPRELSEDVFSLLQDTEKMCLSLDVNIDKNTGEISYGEFYESVVRNNAALTYDNCWRSMLIDWTLMPKIIDSLRKFMGFDIIVDTNDSHVWIETMMIFYNYIAAKRMNSLDFGIYRTQAKKQNILDDMPMDLKFMLMDAAEYSKIPGNHFGLGLDYYTHATSPIRRYVDLIIQRILLDKATDINYSLTQMNYNQKTDKKFYRDLLYLEQIYKLDVLDCVVMDDKDIGDDTLCIYIKNLGKTTKIRLIGIKECNIEKFSQLRLKYYINPNTNRWNKRLVFEQFMENSS